MSEILSFFQAGGPVVVILVILSVVATALSIVKVLQFMQMGVGHHRNLQSVLVAWTDSRPEEATKLLGEVSSPAARVLRNAIAMAPRFGQNIDAAREDVMRVAQEELRDIRRYLRGIEVIAQSAPLLGLLGTVVGMIEVFSQLEAGGSTVDPSRLAGGIWTALLATALGLAIAIVFSVAGAWFEGRVENERSVIETTMSGFFASHGTKRRT